MYMSSNYILNILEKNVVKKLIIMNGEITKENYDDGGFTYLDKTIKLTPEEKSKLIVSPQYIHMDDTIDNLKKKIVLEYGTKISSEMIYLFYLKKTELLLDNVFDMLTQKKTIYIDKNRLFGFLLNIVDVSIDDIEIKDQYTYEDLLKLNIYGEHIMKVPLGLSYNIEDKYPFTVNPYDIIDFDPFLESYSTNIVSTQNKNVLLDYNILGGNIYVCFANDILTNVDKNKSSLLQIYFPFLYGSGIKSSKDLLEKTDILLRDESKLVGDLFKNNNAIVNMFYDMYNTRKNDIESDYKGVKELHFIIHPINEVIFPIDIIFKIFKTDANVPLTKYNTGNRSEKLYRLYSPDIATNGKKMPYIKKSKLLKLSSLISREKSIGIYFEDDNNRIILEFFINGDIRVNYVSRSASATRINEYEYLLDIKEVETYLIGKINMILEPINVYIQKSGYKDISFTGFNDNIEILDLQYTQVVKISKQINVSKYINCLSLIFVLLETDISKGVEIDFKRVSHFNDMSSIDKFISREIKQRGKHDELLLQLVDVFNISKEEALENVSVFMSNIEVEQNLYRNRRLKIKTSSGFPIEIHKDKYTDNIIITMNRISNIKYIDVLLVYIDSLVRITQDIKSSDLDPKVINALCKKKYKKEADVVDIVTINQIPSDESLLIHDGKLVFDDDEEDGEENDTFYNDIFGINKDDDDDDDDETIGDLMQLTGLGDLDEDDEKQEEEETTVLATKQEIPAEKLPEKDEESEDLTIQDGMPLNNPNYFFERMYRRDPKLFLKRKEGKYEAYSRMCPGHWRRQPVIINQDEKDKIDKESPGSYGDKDVSALKYSSEPSKNYYYICPRYWCLKTNMSMTQEQVDAGECGGKIIPYDAKKVPKGSYIYEFNAGRRNNEHINKEGQYMQHYPGFLKSDSHPDGLCVPCCIKNAMGNAQIQRRKECSLGKVERKHEKPKKRGIQRLYVKDMNKFPLDETDIAYLPLSVQKLLNVDNESCRVSKKSNALISNKPCLLRKGVLNKIQNQSFLYAVADMLGITLPILKKQILHKLTLKDFMMLQNGSLIDIFYEEDIKEDLSLITDDTFKHMSKEFVLKVNKSFINYRHFIMDDTVEINYTYTWDLVSNIVFEDKKNLIIVEVLDDDLTDNVDLLCPTNHFSSNGFFDSKKHSIIMIKKDIFYYPVYLFINDKDSGENEIEVYLKEFSVFNPNIGEDLKQGIMKIKDYLSLCKPNTIDHEKYYFRDNISHNVLLPILKKNNYKVVKQILNYDGKKIGFVLETPSKNRLYVPSNVSNILPKIDIIDMNDISIRQDLKTTINELLVLSSLNVPCKPQIKIKEDGMIVGVITETNQFVPLKNPEADFELHSIKTQEGVNTINIDTQLMTTTEEDIDRKHIIKKINLETQFYNTFRNTFRILINQSVHTPIRNKLKSLIDTYDVYLTKLDNVGDLLKELMTKYINFNVYSDKLINTIDIVKPCIGMTECDDVFCFNDTKSNTCKLLIPIKNLINDYDNEPVYFKRLADELIRYTHLHKYYFNKNTHISLDTIDYDLNDNEIIILENLLLGEYFTNIDKLESNKYTKTSTHDYINPITNLKFNNVINLKKNKTLEDDECVGENSNIGTTEKWHSIFEKGTKILKIKQETECMYNTVSNILQDFGITGVSTKGLRELLISIYDRDIKTERSKILMTLKVQGKTNIISRIRRGDNTLSQLITFPDYYLTNMDLIKIFKFYKVPVVFISATKLKENGKRMFVVNYSPETRFYYVIKQYGIVLNAVQKYGILMYKKKNLLDLVSLANSLSDELSTNVLTNEYIKEKRIKLIPKN